MEQLACSEERFLFYPTVTPSALTVWCIGSFLYCMPLNTGCNKLLLFTRAIDKIAHKAFTCKTFPHSYGTIFILLSSRITHCQFLFYIFKPRTAENINVSVPLKAQQVNICRTCSICVTDLQEHECCSYMRPQY